MARYGATTAGVRHTQSRNRHGDPVGVLIVRPRPNADRNGATRTPDERYVRGWGVFAGPH
jgi:hypothetical protein